MARSTQDALAVVMGGGERARVARALALNPEKVWSSQEMAQMLRVRPVLVRQTLRALARAGFARELARRGKERARFAPASGAAFAALQAFVLQVGLPDLEAWGREFSRRVKRVRLVVASGVLAGDMSADREGVPELLIVADKPDPAAVRRAVARLEREVGRELAVALFSREEFAYRRNIRDRAVREVFERPHRVVRGSPEMC